MPCKVQLLLPPIGLELYQLGVQIWAKKPDHFTRRNLNNLIEEMTNFVTLDFAIERN